MWLFRPRLCLGFGKPAPDGIVPLLDKPLLRISDKAAALRLRDGIQLSDGTLHNLPCLPVTDNQNDFFQPRKGFFLRTGGILIDLGIESALKLLGVDLAVLVQDVGIHAGNHVDLRMARVALGGLQVAVVQFQLVGGAGMTEGIPHF